VQGIAHHPDAGGIDARRQRERLCHRGGRIDEARIAVGAVAARPLRLTTVEQSIAGQPLNDETANAAGELAIEGAFALRYNAYKIPLMRNLVRRAVRGGAASATT